MISSYIFSSEILLQFSLVPNASPIVFSEGLAALLVTIKPVAYSTRRTRPLSPSVTLLRIGIKSLSEFQKSTIHSTQIDSLFQSLLFAVDGIDITSQIPKNWTHNIVRMLHEVSSMQTSLSLTTLSQIVLKTADLTSENFEDIQWPIVEQALKNDFDVFVHPSNSKLTLQLFSAICRFNKPNALVDELKSILVLLVQGFAKARDLLGFVNYWKQCLGHGLNSSWCYAPILKQEFSQQVEKCLTSTQIEILVNELLETRCWEILDSTLRGIHKEETEDRLALEKIITTIIEERDEMPCAVWGILVRIGELRPELLYLAIDATQSYLRDIGSWKVAISAAQVIMQVSQVYGLYKEADSVLLVVSNVWAELNGLDKPDNDTIDHLHFAVALTATVVTRHLELVEMMSSSTRTSFIDSFLRATFRYKAASHVWNDMIKAPQFFEYVAWKRKFRAMYSLLRGTYF